MANEAEETGAERTPRRLVLAGGIATGLALAASALTQPAVAQPQDKGNSANAASKTKAEPDPEAPEDDGNQIRNPRALRVRGRHSPHPARARKRRKYLRIDYDNEGAGQTVLFSTDPDGTFVVGNSTGVGLIGESEGTVLGEAAGVRGSARNAPGVEAIGDNVAGLFAVSANRYAVHGIGDNWVGVLGQSSKGYGVQGIAGGSPNTTPGQPGSGSGGAPAPGAIGGIVGVLGQARDPQNRQGKGVQGICDDQDGAGVLGQSRDGFGVLGIGDNKAAVRGQSSNSLGIHGVGRVGVLAEATGNDWALIGRNLNAGGKGISGVGKEVGVEAITEGGAFGVLARNTNAAGVAVQAEGRLVYSGAGVIPVPAGVTFVRRAGVPTASGGNLVLATVQGSSVGVAISHARVSAVGEVEVAFTGPTTAAGQVAFFIVN